MTFKRLIVKRTPDQKLHKTYLIPDWGDYIYHKSLAKHLVERVFIETHN